MSEESIITTAQYESILKEIKSMRDTMDIRFKDWEDQTRNINDILVRVKTVEAKVDGARDDIEDSSKKTLSEVKEHLSPMPDIVSDAVSDAVKKKKGLFK